MSYLNVDFNNDYDYAMKLFNQKRYSEARDYILGKLPISPACQWSEGMWLMAQCDYFLGEYEISLRALNRIINMPMSMIMLRKQDILTIQRQAQELKKEIIKHI